MCDEDPSGFRCRGTFEVLCEATAPAEPGEGAFDDPAAGKQNKALFGFCQLHDDQVDVVGLGLLGRLLAGVSLIDKGHLHLLRGRFLNLLAELSDLRSFLLVGRGDRHGQQMVQGIHATWALDPLLRLYPS